MGFQIIVLDLHEMKKIYLTKRLWKLTAKSQVIAKKIQAS